MPLAVHSAAAVGSARNQKFWVTDGCDDEDTALAKFAKHACHRKLHRLLARSFALALGSGSLMSRLVRAGVRFRIPPNEDAIVAHGERRGETRRHRFDSGLLHNRRIAQW